MVAGISAGSVIAICVIIAFVSTCDPVRRRLYGQEGARVLDARRRALNQNAIPDFQSEESALTDFQSEGSAV